MTSLISLNLHQEHDLVYVRQRARQITRLLGFGSLEQTSVTTALSEIARNALRYGGGGRVDFILEDSTRRDAPSLSQPPALVIHVSDRGPGITDLKTILDGRYISTTGMGMGIVGAKRLLDRLDIETEPGEGTRVTLMRRLPRRLPGLPGIDVKKIVAELAHPLEANPLNEMEQQNQELLRAMETLQERQEELERLNHELADTNRGVMALYAELDGKAQLLQRADALKDSFLSNISHEFRTPLNSIMGLTRLLEERTDGDLTPEQQKQVNLIRRSAEELAELVNDLLDTAKIAAGKVVVYPQEFTIADLFSSLRGMFRPLHTSSEVALRFDDVSSLPPLYTDEAKVAQILRNFISNALKFTERGSVHARAVIAGRGENAAITFSVEDTGIGIAPEDRARIFTEFVQVDGRLQQRAKGTGLGLPLSRRLAELLGGSVSLESTPGVGSTFSVTLPCHYQVRSAHQEQDVTEDADDLAELVSSQYLPVNAVGKGGDIRG